MLIHFSYVRPKWTVAHQIPLSMEFSRQEYWNGLPCSSPGDLSDPGIEPAFLTSSALAGGFFTSSTTWEASPPKKKMNISPVSPLCGLSAQMSPRQ